MDLETSFGRWLRHRRRALDLTQDDLARRVGCAVVSIQKLEADERRPSRLLAERLADSLQIASEDRAAIITLARAEPYRDLAPVEAPEHPLPTPQRPPTNLPAPLTRLIGRKQDIAAVRNALLRGEVRLLTLVGSPGIGKTSLSIEVARDLHAAFGDGTYFVTLAPIGEVALVPAMIAQTLGVMETAGRPLLETLKAVLQAKRLLLVLDNFEHVLDAAPLVVELLEACPGLKALVTSRATLHVRGERLYAVPSLLLPDQTQLHATVTLAHNPAVMLFVERAQAVAPHFTLTAQNAPAVAEICVRLDGLPLAIELAAARIKLLPPEALLARLEQRLVVLIDGARDLPPRHRTLRTAIAWSYELLDLPEQWLFRRLGVFVGGCTLEAVERVCDMDGDLTLDGLQSLLDKSLLQQREGVDGAPHFHMLETICEYALEQLAASGELESLRRRHASFFITLAEAANSALIGPQQLTWKNRLEMERPNLWAALVWCFETEDKRQSTTDQEQRTELGLRLAVALGRFWQRRGYLSEGRRWLARALSRTDAEGASGPPGAYRALRARALGWLSRLALFQNDLAAAQPVFEESLALHQELGDSAGVANVLGDFGMFFEWRSDHGRAQVLVEESLSLYRELGDGRGIASCLLFLGTIAYAQGNSRRAGELWEESLMRYRASGDINSVAFALTQCGMVALDQGDEGRAGAHLAESLTLLRELGDRWQTTLALEVCSSLAAVQAQREADVQTGGRLAARLLGAAEALRETLGAPPPPHHREYYQRRVMAARAQLDEAAFAAAWDAGRTMPLEQAIADALNATSPSPTPSHPIIPQ